MLGLMPQTHSLLNTQRPEFFPGMALLTTFIRACIWDESGPVDLILTSDMLKQLPLKSTGAVHVYQRPG